MKLNLPVYILVKAQSWGRTSFRHPWQKVLNHFFSDYQVYKYGQNRQNNYTSIRSRLASDLNEQTSPQVLLIDLHKSTPNELTEFINSYSQDSSGLFLSTTDKQNLASKITPRLFFGFETSSYSAIKSLPHLVTYNITPEDLSPRSDHSLLSLAKTLSLEPSYIGVRPSKVAEVAHAVAKKIYHLFSPTRPAHIPSTNKDNMVGAGMIHKGQTFITHTTLRERSSATNSFSQKQIFIFICLFSLFISGLITHPIPTMITFTAILSAIYFIDVLFNLYLVSKSIHTPPELEFTKEDLDKLKDSDLPVYTILVPLYKEANVLPHFLSSMENMNYPKEKLDVMLLLEEDDLETIAVAKELNLPKYVRSVIVPHSMPKTKPKACNYGLSLAKGEYVVIYDAEDQPDPDQLKKAVLGFKVSPANVGCLQAKLNYHNKDQNLLTRFFTAEYSLWFDVVLPGLQSINTSIPLGGTSNHFRVKDLIAFQGWDAFNVTEDADLGSRLFKAGYKTAIINSVTLEEANSRVGNWVRQRSRWIKGYMQTFLVHNRNFRKFFKEQGIHAIVFQLTVGGKIAFMLINPLLWIATISYFLLYKYVGPTIESFYPAPVFYMAAFSLVFGNFLFLYYYMIGVAKHGHWNLVKYIYLVPFYWLLISRAALKALYQLFLKPHYWEKTIHGLHLTNKDQKANQALKKNKLVDKITKIKTPWWAGGAFLMGASVASNFINFLYNRYLGNNISLSDFGLISLFGSFLYLTQVPVNAFSKSVTHISAYKFGQKNIASKNVWSYFRKIAFLVALFSTVCWLILTPVLQGIFKSESITPFYIFAPVWIIGMIASVDSGFLSGVQKFTFLAVVSVTESLSKFLTTVILVKSGLTNLVYLSLPLSMTVGLALGWYYTKKVAVDIEEEKPNFPKKFATTSILNKLSNIVFMGLDVVVAKIVLSPDDAGRFALVSLIGKMVYFFSSLPGQFILPLVSKEEGAKGNPLSIFSKIFLGTLVFSVLSFVALGILKDYTVTLLFGQRTQTILHVLPFYLLGISSYTLASSIISYHQSRRKHFLPVLNFFISSIQFVILFGLKNVTLESFSFLIGLFGIMQLLVAGLAHRLTRYSALITNNSYAFFNLFKKQKVTPREFTGQLRFLVLNWRDIKHKWAGGAESYVHELAKNLVDKGHQVTIFSGNDGVSKNREIIDGVEVVRRGGFFTVYFWAAIYYIFKFQDRFDIIIDSENGIPFFTPLYSRRPKFLLMHHVHQEVFNDSLKFPAREIAKFLEGKLMPLVYRKEKVIAVSESTKKDVLKLGIFKPENVCIVNPGIDLAPLTKPVKKTDHPSLLYLGRLRDYKNIDIAIKAFAKVVKQIPEATFTIGGEGDKESDLKKLVEDLNLIDSVHFLGRVSDEDRDELYAKSWLSVQPSSHEGWGITVIEANFFGCPVIASNIPGLCDSVLDGKTGILIKPKSVNGFAKAISKVFRSPKLRQKMSDLGVERARKFNWSENTNHFLEAVENYYFKVA